MEELCIFFFLTDLRTPIPSVTGSYTVIPQSLWIIFHDNFEPKNGISVQLT